MFRTAPGGYLSFDSGDLLVIPGHILHLHPRPINRIKHPLRMQYSFLMNYRLKLFQGL